MASNAGAGAAPIELRAPSSAANDGHASQQHMTTANVQQPSSKRFGSNSGGGGGRMQSCRRHNSTTSHVLTRLLSSLDLRFNDPKVESKYYNYYAQVKRELLPTAIQVVLLLDFLQFLTTCLHLYSVPFTRVLLFPLSLQLAVLIAAFSMLKLVRGELLLRHHYVGGVAGARYRRHHRARRHHHHNRGHQHHRHKRHNQQQAPNNNDDDDNNAGHSGDEGAPALRKSPAQAANRVGIAKHRRQRPTRASGRSSGASGLSASLSLTFEPNYQSGDESDASSNSSASSRSSSSTASSLTSSSSTASSCESDASSCDEQEREGGSKSNAAANSKDVIELNEKSATKQAASTTKRRKCKSHEAVARRKRRKHAAAVTRTRLVLPCALWLCQLVQLASGLWPQQSFISYATLLLYSYTIYVIFPIRLITCVLLSLGLSIAQPLVDYLLLLNLLQPAAQLQSNTAAQQAPRPLSPPQANNTTELADSDASSLQMLTAQTLSDLTSSLAAAINSTLSPVQPQPQPQPPMNLNVVEDNSLLIPMTSQLSKLWAFMMLIVGINVIGIMSFFFYERQQRAAFLETEKSLETKLILEQESQEQERLLLSILPKHLAAEIREDLGAVVTGQFKKIYMSRHENVSILFADIVGFTAISSNCPAPELVKILNELFARFDKLAEKYHQLRIKILGDCYYAISGAPQERPDHAVLCVHMGLSMVDAIKSVREKTKSTVDMRVGVHTGGVLAGVLGQRQWQFDVYSKDVELANKMESSGLPGRVHISDATLRFLNNEFEVSDGNGADREEALKLANIRTYFIAGVNKPYPEGTLDAPVSSLDGRRSKASNSSGQPAIGSGQPQRVGKAHKRDAANSASSNSQATTSGSRKSQQQQQQQQQQLQQGQQHHQQRADSLNVDDQITGLSLHFRNRQYERQFRSTSDVASCISLIGLPITLLCAFLAYLYLYRMQTEVIFLYAILFLLLLLVVLICVLPYLWRSRRRTSMPDARSASAASAMSGGALVTRTSPSPASPVNAATDQQQCLIKSIGSVANAVKENAWMKVTLTMFMTAIWLAAHLIAVKRTSDNLAKVSDSRALQLFTVDLFNYFAIACSLAITAITRISFLIKTISIICVIFLQVIMNMTILSSVLRVRLSRPGGAQTAIDVYTYDQYTFFLTLLAMCWALYLINRRFELTNRKLFLWGKQVERRKEKVADMRQKNEALVYNILPPNVAKLFLGRRTINDEELYSKSYEAVGVLFAAMPNFSDFYTEEAVNKQGLECLRFLNEVISDYDALLNEDRFKNIIKIKTMGSTYMAASGLYEGDALDEQNEQRELERAAAKDRDGGGDDSPPAIDADEVPDEVAAAADGKEIVNVDDVHALRVKWGHLKQLTEFALALKETLNNINKESFNNFVLRIGINHGPITAGVIGAKKPHFDMWGNTVNVASRMESTGRAGSIQVVEETSAILRHFGFQFDQRGLVFVKGKGKLMTYYLTGRQPSAPDSPAIVASASASGSASASVSHPQQQQQQQQAARASAAVPQSASPTAAANDKLMFITSPGAGQDKVGSDASVHLV